MGYDTSRDRLIQHLWRAFSLVKQTAIPYAQNQQNVTRKHAFLFSKQTSRNGPCLTQDVSANISL